MIQDQKQVMVCKLQLHSTTPATGSASDNSPLSGARLRFGGVWEGSTEKQAASENAIFGHWTPNAEFAATVLNQHVVDQLVVGKKYYLTFTEAPD
jgi:hypothetical protein